MATRVVNGTVVEMSAAEEQAFLNDQAADVAAQQARESAIAAEKNARDGKLAAVAAAIGVTKADLKDAIRAALE